MRAALVILISGPVNAGKTAVAAAVASLLPGTAHVEVDALRAFVPWMPLADAIPVGLESAAVVARVLLRRDLNVVVDYPLSAADRDFFLGALAVASERVHAFTLRVPLEVLLTDRGDRRLADRERARILEQHRAAAGEPTVGTVVDNHGRTAEETARAILGLIRQGPARPDATG